MVQNGSRKDIYEVEFKDLFNPLKKCLSDGHNRQYFFRDLMAMITSVTEEEWGTDHDPSSKKVKDETILNFIKRGLSQPFAASIVNRLTPEILTERINERPKSTRDALAKELRPYDNCVTEDNVGECAAKMLVAIILRAGGLSSDEDLERVNKEVTLENLKRKYGAALYQESNGICHFPGCGKQLYRMENGRIEYVYSICVIDDSKNKSVSNLIALCPDCNAKYIVKHTKKLTSELKITKKTLVSSVESKELLDDIRLDEGITKVISKIKNLSEQDFDGIMLDPKEISQKVSPDNNYVLYKEIYNNVSLYFVRVRDILMNMDKRGEIVYEDIQNQMRSLFTRLRKNNKSQTEIYEEIAAKIHNVSWQEDIYCKIVVSYFVQSCEVFDAIAQ